MDPPRAAPARGDQGGDLSGTDVGALDEFPAEGGRVVTVGDKEIGIIRWGDRVFAVRNICPHMLAPVCEGGVGPRIFFDEDRADVQVDAEHPVVVCPWHGWEFDVQTGRCLIDPRERVRTYPARVAGGRVVVDVPIRPATAD